MGQKEADKLFVDLLFKMSQVFRYKFDKVHIDKSVYSPKAYGDNDLAFIIIRNKLVDILRQGSIPMKITYFPATVDNPSEQQIKIKVLELLEKCLSGQSSIKVEMKDPKKNNL